LLVLQVADGAELLDEAVERLAVETVLVGRERDAHLGELLVG